jgi:Fe(3+) dicitrate transport protein
MLRSRTSIGISACLSLAIMLGTPLAQAQDAARTPETTDEKDPASSTAEDARRDISIVVIGKRQNLLRVPGSGATIEGDQLERSRVFTVNEALRTVPGIFPRDEEGLGMRPNIGVRGLNPTRSTKVLLLEDGIPLAFAPYGDNATYFHPPVRRYDRIEVLKGASQVRFGPQTIGGVINYITPRVPETFEAKGLLAGGSRDYLEIEASVGGPFVGGRALAHAQMKESAGARENTFIRMNDVSLKAEWDVATDQVITVRASRFAEDSQVTYSGLTLAEYLVNPFANPFPNDRFTTERWGGSLSHAWFLSDAVSLKSTAYGSYFTRDWWRQSSNSSQRPNDSSDAACAGMANLNTTCGNEGRLRDYDVLGLETRLSADAQLGDIPARFEAGLRYHIEDQHRRQWNGDTPTSRNAGIGVNAGIREDNDRNIDALSGFISGQFRFGSLLVEPGARFEHIDYERLNRLNGAKGKTSLETLIPGLGVIYEVSPTTVLYAGVHKGFAPPRVEDIISNTTGATVDLAEEESINWELGVRGTVAPGVYGDVGLFRLDFSNQVIPASVAGGVGATLTSAGETIHEGAELLLRASARDAGWPGFASGRDDVQFRLAATWLWSAEFAGTRFSTVPGSSCSGFTPPVPGPTCVLVTGNRLPYAPEVIVSAAIGYDWQDTVYAEVEMQYTGEMFTDDLQTVVSSADGQRGLIGDVLLWNATVNVDIPDTNLTVYATVKNLTDEVYIADRTRGIIPGAPRLVQAGVAVRF